MKLYRLLIFMLIFTFYSCATEYVHVGPNWNALNNLSPDSDSFKVNVTGTRSAKLGQELSFAVTSETDGKLWIVQADPEDNSSVIFPNDEMSDNHIRAGETLSIPPKGAQWGITAQEPRGKSILAFIVTTGDADIEDILGHGRNMQKTISVVRSSRWGMAKMVVDIQ